MYSTFYIDFQQNRYPCQTNVFGRTLSVVRCINNFSFEISVSSLQNAYTQKHKTNTQLHWFSVWLVMQEGSGSFITRQFYRWTCSSLFQNIHCNDWRSVSHPHAHFQTVWSNHWLLNQISNFSVPKLKLPLLYKHDHSYNQHKLQIPISCSTKTEFLKMSKHFIHRSPGKQFYIIKKELPENSNTQLRK